MRIGIASDHGGFHLRELLIESLRKWTIEFEDFGAASYDAGDDFPDYVVPLAKAIESGRVQRGIALCGSGVGACIAANKVPGVRACTITDIFSAHQGVEDDNMNIICLGGRVLGWELARDLIRAFLDARFIGAERHLRRLGKVAELERGCL